jgi:pentatricopeptide repeat protein
LEHEVVCAKVIYFLCREGCLDEALKLCKEMELKGTMPYDGYYDPPGVTLSREHNDLLAYNRVLLR